MNPNGIVIGIWHFKILGTFFSLSRPPYRFLSNITNNKLRGMEYFIIAGQLGPFDFKTHVRNLFFCSLVFLKTSPFLEKQHQNFEATSCFSVF